jgi:chromosome segregation ATPase
MPDSDKLDQILEEMKDYRREFREELKDHGECLARLDERTEQQDKRLDRVQSTSTAYGSVAGGVLAVVVSIFWKIFGGHGA